jgi:hypothetical protein
MSGDTDEGARLSPRVQITELVHTGTEELRLSPRVQITELVHTGTEELRL